jgi:hypothetical protein
VQLTQHRGRGAGADLTQLTQPTEISLSLSVSTVGRSTTEEAETVLSITTADTAQSTASERDRSNVLRTVGCETSRTSRTTIRSAPASRRSQCDGALDGAEAVDTAA